VPADSPIKVPTDLKGKAIGVHSATGSAGEFTTQSSLAASGLRPTDYTLVTIGMDKQALGALTSGQVQAVGLPLYELAPFMVEGLKLRIFRHPVIGDTPNGGYAAADAVMAAKSDQIGRFSRAIVKASLLIRYNPSAAARAMLTAQGKPFTDADQRRITAELTAWEDDLPASDPNSPTIGAISPEGMARYIKLLADSGVTRTVVPVSEVVTNQFIPYANAIDRKAFEARAEAMR
jgi:NitT/TauT family transport system substrate-binding protein